MADPKLPRNIAKKIAQLGRKPLPSRAPAPETEPTAPVRKDGPGGGPGIGPIVLAMGWVLALLLGALAYAEYQWFGAHQQTALDRQKADYELQLKTQAEAAETKLKAALGEREAAHASAMQSAQATQQAIQTELDYAKLPELPLKISMQPPALSGGARVLSVSNETNDEVSCRVHLKRPIGGKEKTVEFTIKPRGFRDLGALEGWEFTRGDVIEFQKTGYKPRRLDVP